MSEIFVSAEVSLIAKLQCVAGISDDTCLPVLAGRLTSQAVTQPYDSPVGITVFNGVVYPVYQFPGTSVTKPVRKVIVGTGKGYVYVLTQPGV